ncbi:SRPBCC family protein [Nocardia halotolerans]|uniref:SRPBCC family protein n=1 Tax=Nocardia halotolerans TaxID=1755878 RepID=A0ABV8VGK9_9NOCA
MDEDGLVRVRLTVPAPVQDVFAVLADGWSYTGWVVGASHIRAVDSGWPQVGTRIHHSVGPWPLTVDDSTEVRAADPPYSLELDARLWPAGAAVVRLDLREVGPRTTEVVMGERAVGGPGRILPHAVQKLVLVPRNRESLVRLADMAVGRSRAAAPPRTGG